LIDPTPTQSELEIRLAERLRTAEAARDAISVRWNQIANLRLALAAAVAIAGFWWIRTGVDTTGLLAGAIALAFIGSLVWHRRVGARRHDLVTRVILRSQAIARLNRDWGTLQDPPAAEIPIDHPYARDLDLVGHGSLQGLIDTTQTPAGNRTLLAWLADGAPTAEIRERQQIARELVDSGEWREDLTAAGLGIGRPSGDAEFLLRWLESAAQKRTGFRHIVAVVLAVATLTTIGLYALDVVAFAWLLPLLVANAVLTFAAPDSGQLSRINSHQRSLSQYRAVLPIAERMPGVGPESARLRAEFDAADGSASHQLATLDRALAFVIPSGTIIWFPLQVAVNWDLLVELRLRRLAARIGPHIRDWISVIGRVEALAAFGNAAALNQDWTWPDVSTEADALEARALGHPLLPSNRMVPNDVTVGPPGTVLIVTGSNMAGKSTLLRAMGLNVVLARAGGPVCAGSLIVPNYPVWSSVRIQDSLEQGVSLYMAELLRLKQIVVAARSGPILYLLDEILHGTNTSERRIAARSVIRQLIGARSIGAVSTHDLELVDANLEGPAECVHLVDQIVDGPDGPEMVFDYTLRPGLAPTSNALRLLELVGLGDGTMA
jgi:hypothetical protein